MRNSTIRSNITSLLYHFYASDICPVERISALLT